MANLSRLQDADRVLVLQNAARERTKTGDTEGALGWVNSQASMRDKALALEGVAEGILSRTEARKR
jgi:hypothetical protein